MVVSPYSKAGVSNSSDPLAGLWLRLGPNPCVLSAVPGPVHVLVPRLAVFMAAGPAESTCCPQCQLDPALQTAQGSVQGTICNLCPGPSVLHAMLDPACTAQAARALCQPLLLCMHRALGHGLAMCTAQEVSLGHAMLHQTSPVHCFQTQTGPLCCLSRDPWAGSYSSTGHMFDTPALQHSHPPYET